MNSFSVGTVLTRRAKAKSARHAVVVRFSRSRRRYERQGLLVEPKALSAAQDEVEKERQASDSRRRPGPHAQPMARRKKVAQRHKSARSVLSLA